MSRIKPVLRAVWAPLVALALSSVALASYTWNQSAQEAATTNLVSLISAGQKTVGVIGDRRVAESTPAPDRGALLASMGSAKYGTPVSLGDLAKMEADGRASVKRYEERHLSMEGPLDVSWGFSIGSVLLLGFFAMALALREFRRSMREGAGL